MTSSGPPPGDNPGLRVLSIGECMMELRPDDTDRYRLGYGGDTLNTAVYLARLGIAADYATALGDDPYSDDMASAWRDEGVGTDLVVRLTGRLPGFYIIRNAPDGERSFYYWRASAAARELFSCEHTSNLIDKALAYDWIYLSGVTLSLYDAGGSATLLELLNRFRAVGGRVAFDSNYRPRVWRSETVARKAFDELYGHVDLALPSFEDEQSLYGDTDIGSCIDRLAKKGVGEIVVKQGEAGCTLSADGERKEVAVDRPVAAVDATAAGDAFNAGFLAGRLKGLDIVSASRAGQRLAAAVVMQRGAIIPREAMPDRVLER